VYALPILILACLPLAIMVVPAFLSGNSNTQDLASAVATAGGFVGLCLLCVFGIYGLGLTIINPAIYVEYSHKGTFAACFNFREIFALIGRNAGAFFTAWGVFLGTSIAASLVAGLVGTLIGWIPCLGQVVGVVVGFAAGVYIWIVYGHLFGQFSAIETGSQQLAKA
jgi:hypothetical protein